MYGTMKAIWLEFMVKPAKFDRNRPKTYRDMSNIWKVDTTADRNIWQTSKYQRDETSEQKQEWKKFIIQ